MMLGQIAARAELEGAFAWLGAFKPGIVRVVLHCVPVPVWAAETGRTDIEAMGWVLAGLDRLALFYVPESKPRRAVRSLSFGPSRESYAIDA